MAKITQQQKQEIITRIRNGDSAAKVANDYHISAGYATQLEAAAPVEATRNNGNTWGGIKEDEDSKQFIYADLVDELNSVKTDLVEMKIMFAEEVLKRRREGGIN